MVLHFCGLVSGVGLQALGEAAQRLNGRALAQLARVVSEFDRQGGNERQVCGLSEAGAVGGEFAERHVVAVSQAAER
jgi:hypothetical protein